MSTGRLLLGLSLAGILATAAVRAEDGEKCDLKETRVEKVCVVCDEVVKKGDEHCGEKAEKVEFCIKTVYVCEDCDESSSKSGKCPSCEKKMTKSEDKARTFWECPECGSRSDSKGKCEECEKDLVKTCESSGQAPHVAPSNKKGKAKRSEDE